MFVDILSLIVRRIAIFESFLDGTVLKKHYCCPMLRAASFAASCNDTAILSDRLGSNAKKFLGAADFFSQDLFDPSRFSWSCVCCSSLSLHCDKGVAVVPQPSTPTFLSLFTAAAATTTCALSEFSNAVHLFLSLSLSLNTHLNRFVSDFLWCWYSNVCQTRDKEKLLVMNAYVRT